MRKPVYYLVTWGDGMASIFIRPGAATRFRFGLMMRGIYSSIEARYV